MSGSSRADGQFFGHGSLQKLCAVLGLRDLRPPRTVRCAFLAAMVCWAPLAVLAAGGDDLAGLLTDFGAYARFLIAVPVLVLSEPYCGRRLGAVASHFADADLVPEFDRARYTAALASTRRLGDSLPVKLLLFALTCTIVGMLQHWVPGKNLFAWQLAGNTVYSWAGWWHLLVSVPILILFILESLWRLFLWVRFLCLISRSELRLIAAHPDHTAGLLFVCHSVRAFAGVAFAFGMIAAGTVMNQVVHRGASLVDFKYTVLDVVALVVLLFGSPPLVFTGKLVEVWRRGVFEYGRIANNLGREFEQQWLNAKSPLTQDALHASDFSATIDLYSVVANVYAMRFMPADLLSVASLAGATLLPFLPVVFVALPFDEILKRVAALLL